MTRLRHFDHPGTIRFVTFSSHRGYGWLTERDVPEIFLKWLDTIRVQDGIGILGYVIMPDHIHLVLFSPDTIALGEAVERLKGHTAGDVLSLWQSRDGAIPTQFRADDSEHPSEHRLWHPGCEDYNCRGGESVREKIQYCHNNPVTRGLVNEPGDWPWSSYRWYQGERDVPLRIDSLSPK
jgi:putative transposase